MKISEIYNRYIDSALENIAESYKEQCDNPSQSIRDEDDQYLISYIYNELKQYVNDTECLMDCVIEHFADKNTAEMYRKKILAKI